MRLTANSASNTQHHIDSPAGDAALLDAVHSPMLLAFPPVNTTTISLKQQRSALSAQDWLEHNITAQLASNCCINTRQNRQVSTAMLMKLAYFQ